jgi:Tfp pilus assembly protein PilO
VNTILEWRRALHEYRRPGLALAVMAAVNLIGWGLVVRPLAARVGNIEERGRLAVDGLRLAQAENRRARGALIEDERSLGNLNTFYTEVLPLDLAGARRLTHLRLAQVARKAGLQFERFSFDPEPMRDSGLTRVRGDLILSGSYAQVRAFVHRVETSKDFVVLDDIGLAEGAGPENVLLVTVKLSTYFRSTPLQILPSAVSRPLEE